MALKAWELAELLGAQEPGLDVAIRLNLSDALDDPEDLDGEYLEVHDNRSVLVENGRVVIIADVVRE
jgi:hypothetical protein